MSDYVSRGDVLNALCGECKNYNICFFGEGEIPVCPLFWKMQNIPAADVVERKSGRCLPKARYFYCSECGYAVADVFEGAYDHDDEKVFVFEKGEEWHYCPNCGADMRNGGDEA